MSLPQKCPVCLDLYSTHANVREISDFVYHIDCPICGKFELGRTTWEDFLDPQSSIGTKLTPSQRARITHRTRTATVAGMLKVPCLSSGFLDQYIKDGCPGPHAREQAVNAIRIIGDEIKRTAQKIR